MSTPRLNIHDLNVVGDAFEHRSVPLDWRPDADPAQIPSADADPEFWRRYARVTGPHIDTDLMTADERDCFVRACKEVAREPAMLPSANIGKPVANNDESLAPDEKRRHPDYRMGWEDGLDAGRAEGVTLRSLSARHDIRRAYWRGVLVGGGLAAATAAFLILLLRGAALSMAAL